MKPAEDRSNVVFQKIPAVSYIADYERCDNVEQMEAVLTIINRNGYQLVSVTQDSKDNFYVFFRRLVMGCGGAAH